MQWSCSKNVSFRLLWLKSENGYTWQIASKWRVTKTRSHKLWRAIKAFLKFVIGNIFLWLNQDLRTCYSIDAFFNHRGKPEHKWSILMMKARKKISIGPDSEKPSSSHRSPTIFRFQTFSASSFLPKEYVSPLSSSACKCDESLG